MSPPLALSPFLVMPACPDNTEKACSLVLRQDVPLIHLVGTAPKHSSVGVSYKMRTVFTPTELNVSYKNCVMFGHSFLKNFVTLYSVKGIGMARMGGGVSVQYRRKRYKDEKPYAFKSSSK